MRICTDTMESESAVVLESCEEDSILMQTVKNMVTEDVHTGIDSKEEGFFIVTDVTEGEQQNVIEVCNEETTITDNGEHISLSNLCRVCANANDHLIPIFDGEGLEHDLCSKIHKYLPIHISDTDELPLQLCYHCAATLLAWHELLEGCLTAERRLLTMQESLQVKQSSDGLEVSIDTTTSNITESLHQEQETIKDEDCGEVADNDMNRWKNQPEDVTRLPTMKTDSTNAEEIEYVQCTQCNVVFASMKYFVEHMNAEHQTEMHYCQFCELMYHGREKDFDEHMLMHGGNEDGLLDPTLDHSKNEPRHLEPMVAEESVCFTCNLCERTFTKKSDLKKHINWHSDANRIQHPDETELVNSAKQIINDRMSYKCNTCGKVIFTKRGFLRHIRVHSDKRPCKCDQCGKSYRIEQDLARHVRDVHEGLKKYACDICGRAFANKGAKDDHRRIHTGERPYACEHCPKMFRTLNSIYIHNRVHTDYKPHKCSYCGKYFRSKQRLTHHETTHTGIKAFACEICGKTFSVKGEVVRHRAIHNEEKPFDCKCGMKFGQKRYLRNHIKLHHKEASSWLLEELLGSN